MTRPALALLLAACIPPAAAPVTPAQPTAVVPTAPAATEGYRCTIEPEGGAASAVACAFGPGGATLESPAGDTWLKGQIERTPSGFHFVGEAGLAGARHELRCEFFALGPAFEAVAEVDGKLERLRVEPVR